MCWGTESALHHVQIDLVLAMDSKQGSLLMFLDFDTVYHDIPIKRLNTRIEISGQVVPNRILQTDHNTSTSSSICMPVETGVPQGLVLGPILFTIYTSPLGDVVRSYGVSYHLYADYTQLYSACNPSSLVSQEPCVHIMESCTAIIILWMAVNFINLLTTRQNLS